MSDDNLTKVVQQLTEAVVEISAVLGSIGVIDNRRLGRANRILGEVEGDLVALSKKEKEPAHSD